jgi:hypothetical protein
VLRPEEEVVAKERASAMVMRQLMTCGRGGGGWWLYRGRVKGGEAATRVRWPEEAWVEKERASAIVISVLMT